MILALVDIFHPEFTTAYSGRLDDRFNPDNELEPFGVWMHVPTTQIPNLPSPLASVEFGVSGGTLIHFNVPLPWSKQARKLRPAFEACRDAGLLTPR